MLTHHRDTWRRGVVAPFKVPALKHLYLQGFKETWGDNGQTRLKSLL
jgi:hypothetical protein